jgi:hypothetical protein
VSKPYTGFVVSGLSPSVLLGGPRDRQFGEVAEEVNAWVQGRNVEEAVVDWQFSTEDARVKLKRLSPRTQ